MQAIALLAPVMRKLGPRANPGNLKKVPLSAVALWAFYVGALRPDRLRLYMLSVCCCSPTTQMFAKMPTPTVWAITTGLWHGHLEYMQLPAHGSWLKGKLSL